MPDRLTLLELPMLRGERVILRERRDSDIDDRLRYPIDPEEEDGYGPSWRRQWDGRRYHTREHLVARQGLAEPGCYSWTVEHEGHCHSNHPRSPHGSWPRQGLRSTAGSGNRVTP